ncbi:MAG: hypothetical protein EBY89_07815, partial [Actinobacteria bacterium]|nr:hypothetical protein [Actinomycetota bacterium]
TMQREISTQSMRHTSLSTEQVARTVLINITMRCLVSQLVGMTMTGSAARRGAVESCVGFLSQSGLMTVIGLRCRIRCC